MDRSEEVIDEMMESRGYDLDYVNDNVSTYSRNAIQLQVFRHPNPKFGTNDVQYYEKQIKNSDITKCIIILQEETPSSAALEYIKNLKVQRINIEWFLTKELQYNLTKNRLVPFHEILTMEQKRNIISSFSTTPQLMPKILSTDPVMRYLGAVSGQLVRITRKSEVMKGEDALSYRIVV